MSYDDPETKLLVQINDHLNLISLGGGVAVILIISTASYFYRQTMNRLSIRFTLVISVIDVLKALGIIAYSHINEDGFLCSLVSFLTHWLTLVYFFLNVSIAVNLQLVFIHGLTPLEKWEKLYWLISFMAPSILLLFPLSAGIFGMDVEAGFCEFRNPQSSETIFYLWFSFMIWSLIACIYCTITVAIVILNLHYKVERLENMVFKKIHRSKQDLIIQNNLVIKQQIKKLCCRISLYCIIPIITQLGYLIVRIIVCYTDDIPISLLFISVIGTDLPGLLNFFALLLDPAFDSVIKELIAHRKKKTNVLELVNYSDQNLSSFQNTFLKESSIIQTSSNSPSNFNSKPSLSRPYSFTAGITSTFEITEVIDSDYNFNQSSSHISFDLIRSNMNRSNSVPGSRISYLQFIKRL